MVDEGLTRGNDQQMTEHRFKVGQTVEYYPPHRMYAPRGAYHVTAELPVRAGELNIGSNIRARTTNGSRRRAISTKCGIDPSTRTFDRKDQTHCGFGVAVPGGRATGVV